MSENEFPASDHDEEMNECESESEVEMMQANEKEDAETDDEFDEDS